MTLPGSISWVQRNLSHAFNASRNILITMGWRGISRHHIWWIVNVTFAICQSYMRCTCDSMLKMSIALKHDTWVPPFQVWSSWTCPLSISILSLLVGSYSLHCLARGALVPRLKTVNPVFYDFLWRARPEKAPQIINDSRLGPFTSPPSLKSGNWPLS